MNCHRCQAKEHESCEKFVMYPDGDYMEEDNCLCRCREALDVSTEGFYMTDGAAIEMGKVWLNERHPDWDKGAVRFRNPIDEICYVFITKEGDTYEYDPEDD